MIRKLYPSICFMFLLAVAIPVYADDQTDATKITLAKGSHGEISLGLGNMNGYTQYQRGGLVTNADGSIEEIQFPLSELYFPLDVKTARLDVALSLGHGFTIGGGITKNLTNKAGDMEDSDWGLYYLNNITQIYDQYGNPIPFINTTRPDTLDSFSRSEAELDALIWEVYIGYAIIEHPTWTFSGELGYQHQNFQYDMYNVDAWYPSQSYYTGYQSGSDTREGKVLEYEITYMIPYVKAVYTGKITNRIGIEAGLGYAPRVRAEDRDDHLVSSPPHYSKASYKGDAWMYDLKAWFALSKDWSLGVQYDYINIDTEGESDDFAIDGTFGDSIDQDSKSIQKELALNLRLNF